MEMALSRVFCQSTVKQGDGNGAGSSTRTHPSVDRRWVAAAAWGKQSKPSAPALPLDLLLARHDAENRDETLGNLDLPFAEELDWIWG